MKTKKLLLGLCVAVLFLCGVAQADVGVTYTDKVVWRGFELFGETDAMAPQVNLDIGDLSVDARGILANDSGFQALERWDAQVSYCQRAGPLELTSGYGYFYYPDSDLDFQEISETIALPIGPVTPRYSLVRADTDGDVESAWLHVVGIDLALNENTTSFVEATYNEGFNPFGGSVDTGWTHLLAGAAMNVPLGEQIQLRPGVYYQHTWDEQVNPKDDQVWFSVGLFLKL